MNDEYLHPWNFDGEPLEVYYRKRLSSATINAVLTVHVTKIKSESGEFIPSDSPLYIKAKKRFEGEHRSGKLKLKPSLIEIVPK